MTVSNLINNNSYTTDGVTQTFPFTFRITDASQIQVFLDSVLQSAGTYTLLTNAATTGIGGSVTTNAVIAASHTLRIQRTSDFLQNNSLGNNQALPPQTIEAMIDKVTIIAQQINAAIATAPIPPVASNITNALGNGGPNYLVGLDATGLLFNFLNPVTVFQNAFPNAGAGNVNGTPTTVGNIPTYTNANGQQLGAGIAPGAAGNVPTSNGTNWVSSAAAAVIYNNVRSYLNTGAQYTDGSSSGNATIFAGPIPTGKIQTVDSGAGALSTVTLTEISLSIAGLLINTAYSLFMTNTAGVQSLEVLAWSGTNTAPTYGKDAAGRLCKSGSTNKLLINEFMCSAAGKVFNWTGERSFINTYNQIEVPIFAQMGVSSWNYGTGTTRASNANTTNGQGRVGIFIGSIPSAVGATFVQNISNPGSGSNPAYAFGIALDSTTVLPSLTGTSTSVGVNTSTQTTCTSQYNGMPSIGSHFLQMVENAVGGVATATIYGNSANNGSGLSGTMAA